MGHPTDPDKVHPILKRREESNSISSQKIKYFGKVFTEYHETLMCMSRILRKANTEPFKSPILFLV